MSAALQDIPTDAARKVTIEELIGEALEEQQDLSPVERFSNKHETGLLKDNSRHYQELIPSGMPGANQQFAFEVDMDKCSSCKSCVVACHNLNGLREDETWRKTGLLLGGTAEEPYKQTITTACHHCLEPACMNGCPTLAYEKDEQTGIVRHLDDQCIGCKYCTMTCPYGVPQYSQELGIVRKCDMCFNRLKDGEAPACVQACPSAAISIRLVDKDEVAVRRNAEENEFLVGAPHPKMTGPTTQFVSAKAIPQNARPADIEHLEPEEAHLPLVLMLIMTQLGFGVLLVAAAIVGLSSSEDWLQKALPYAIAGVLIGGLGAALGTLHLGRPMYAFRAFLGWRTSWMSREIIALGGFIKIASVFAVLLSIPLISDKLGVELPDVLISRFAVSAAAIATVLAGLGGIFSSAMLYHATGRRLWHISLVGGRFLLTAFIGGFAVGGLYSALVVDIGLGHLMSVGLCASGIAKLALEAFPLQSLGESSSFGRTARLIVAQPSLAVARFALGLLGTVVLPIIALLATPCLLSVVFIVAMLVLIVIGEFIARYLFFTTVTPIQMPGEAL